MALTFLAITIAVGMASWKCFAPNKSFVGLVTRNGELVDVIDTRNWFMTTPKFWNNEKVVWVDLLPEPVVPGDRRCSSDWNELMTKNWEWTLGINGVDYQINATGIRDIKLSGFEELQKNGESVSHERTQLYTQIEREVQRVIGEAEKSPGPDLRTIALEVKQALATEQTTIFYYRDIVVKITLPTLQV